MKKITLILLLCSIANCMFAQSENEKRKSVTVEGITYLLRPKTQTARAIGTESRDIEHAIIPETVTHDGINYKVTTTGWTFEKCKNLKSVQFPVGLDTIGQNTFYLCDALESVDIPNTVRCIGSQAFIFCSSLKSISIPNSVTKIEDGAFRDCSSLSSITIPNSVEEIGSGAFSGCAALTSFVIPEGVEKIEANPFAACSNLNEIEVAGGDKFFFENNCLISKDGVLVMALDRRVITVPNSVKIIGKSAFVQCVNLSEVVLPNSLVKIENYAFSGCKNLKSINIPKNVVEIDEYAFDGTEGIKLNIDADNPVFYMSQKETNHLKSRNDPYWSIYLKNL